MYYINFNGSVVGPMSVSQMLSYPIDSNTPVSRDSVNWMPLYNYPELMEALNAKMSGTPGEASLDSKRIVAGIRAILVGCPGIQYFIIGRTTAGIITIILSLCTCGLWEIITLIQGIMMLTMSDREFAEKYIYSPSTLPLF